MIQEDQAGRKHLVLPNTLDLPPQKSPAPRIITTLDNRCHVVKHEDLPFWV